MHRWVSAAVACVLVGIGLPRLELAYACIRPASEGCVWGRALINVNTVATTVIVGIPVGMLVAWMGRRR